MFLQSKQIGFKTYQAGLLQAKAYRALYLQMTEALKPYGITLPEWGLLGLLHDKKTLRPSELSIELGVKPPVTAGMLKELEGKGLIERSEDSEDSRVSEANLSDKGKRLVTLVEKDLRKNLNVFLKDIKTNDLLCYVQVLEKLSQKISK